MLRAFAANIDGTLQSKQFLIVLTHPDSSNGVCRQQKHHLGDVQDFLCGPTDSHFTRMTDPVYRLPLNVPLSLFKTWLRSLRCKEQDERIAEAEARANLWLATPTD